MLFDTLRSLDNIKGNGLDYDFVKHIVFVFKSRTHARKALQRGESVSLVGIPNVGTLHFSQLELRSVNS